MKERFEGDGHHNLIDALKRQEFVCGDADLANEFAKSGHLVEFSKGDKIITEGAEDNDIYMLLAGSAAIVVKGNDINTRKAFSTVFSVMIWLGRIGFSINCTAALPVSSAATRRSGRASAWSSRSR